MDTIQQGIVAFLKAAITGEGTALPEDFDISAAYPLMQRHYAAPLFYEGAIRCGISSKEAAMQQLFQIYCRMLMKSEAQMHEVQRLFAAFDEQGIDYLPLKGCRMKRLYPKPEMRVMDDADVLIRLEQYEQIKPLLQQLGFREKSETVHELVWYSPALYLELHKQLIPSYNEDLYGYFGNGWQRALPDCGSSYRMPAEDEWLFLFTHFAKHFRDGGIGCRHVVDLWVYLRSHPQLDEGRIRAGLEQLQLTEFHDNIRRLIAFWFEGAAGDGKTELISQVIFDSGSFGQSDTHILSRAVREADRGDRQRNGRMAYLRDLCFPNAQALQGKYKVLKKAPWLLPAVWVYRPFYKMFAEGETVKNQKQKLDVITEERLDARRQLLRDVGLEYRF